MTYGNLLLGASILFIIAGILGLWFISPRCPKGTIFLIALVLFFVGISNDKSETRELRVLYDSLQFLGVAGFILSVVDMFRPRKSKSEEVINHAKGPIPIKNPEVISLVGCFGVGLIGIGGLGLGVNS